MHIKFQNLLNKIHDFFGLYMGEGEFPHYYESCSFDFSIVKLYTTEIKILIPLKFLWVVGWVAAINVKAYLLSVYPRDHLAPVVPVFTTTKNLITLSHSILDVCSPAK